MVRLLRTAAVALLLPVCVLLVARASGGSGGVGLRAAPGGLIHPLKPPVHASGSFGEYRKYGRYHLGLDYKTFNRTGLRVVAPAAGVVTALNVSDRGYGNALWVRSRGDLFTFGHLQDFHGRHEGLEFLRRALELLSPGDVRIHLPAWFSYRAGEALARSGESGSGAPHLHFEVLRAGRYLNPLELGLRIDDQSAPELLHLFVTDSAGTRAVSLEVSADAAASTAAPSGPGQTQATGSGAKSTRAPNVRETQVVKQSYVVVAQQAVVAAPGSVRFSIGTFDTMAAENRNAPTHWRLSDNSGKTLFRRSFRSVQAGRLHGADAVYDPARTVIGQEYVYRLYAGSRGVVSGKSGGNSSYQVEVADSSGNTATLSFNVRFEPSTAGVAPRRSSESPNVYPGRSSTLRSASGGASLSLRFDANSLHLPGSFSVSPLAKLPEGSLLAPDGRKVFEPVGPAFEVRAESAYYQRGAYGSAEYPEPPAGSALYSYNLTTKRWHALAYARKSGGGVVYRFGYRSSGPIAQLRDVDAPRIGRSFLWTNPAKREGSFLTRGYVVSDRGMGLRAAAFRVLLDGRELPFTWTADRGTLSVRIPAQFLADGGAVLAIQAGDFAGNKSEWMLDFFDAPAVLTRKAGGKGTLHQGRVGAAGHLAAGVH